MTCKHKHKESETMTSTLDRRMSREKTKAKNLRFSPRHLEMYCITKQKALPTQHSQAMSDNESKLAGHPAASKTLEKRMFLIATPLFVLVFFVSSL